MIFFVCIIIGLVLSLIMFALTSGHADPRTWKDITHGRPDNY